MASQPVDYGALAEQARKGSVDYAALAAQARGEKKGYLRSLDEQVGASQFAQHPIDTLMGIPAALLNEGKRSYSEIKAANSATDPVEVQRHITAAVPFMGKGVIEGGNQVEQGDYAGAAGTLTGIALNTFGPEAIPAAGKAIGKGVQAAPKVARIAGEVAQNQAGAMINRAAGTLKPDFKRGANPGRGYLAEGGGIATSMQDLADRSKKAVGDAGQRIGDLYQQADSTGKIIPVQDVYNAIAVPMKDAYKISKRVRGLKEDLDFHAKSFESDFQKGIAQGGFTPSEVWQLKQDLAESTSWGDATQMGMKKIKQQQVGKLSGVLQDAIPDLADANQSYMDLLKLAGRAEERAATGSKPLTGHMRDIGSMTVAAMAGEGLHGSTGAIAAALAAKALRSIPGRTATATGLYNVGGGLMSVADRIENLMGKAQTPASVPNPAQAVVGNPVGNQVAPPPQSIRITKIKRLTP